MPAGWLRFGRRSSFGLVKFSTVVALFLVHIIYSHYQPEFVSSESDADLVIPTLKTTQKRLQRPDIRSTTDLNTQIPMQIYHNYSLSVTLDRIEHFQAALPPLLPHFKNPCWLESVPEKFSYKNSYYNSKPCSLAASSRAFATVTRILDDRRNRTQEPCWRMRCFPYFFVLGAPKAGTTDLYNSLTRYLPDVLPNIKKESQFWSRSRFGDYYCRPAKASFADYLDTYDMAAEQIRHKWKKVNRKEYHYHIVGEFTPANYNRQVTWQSWAGNLNQSEPRVTLADHIYHIRPETKVIFSLRDPVARAISHFYFLGLNTSIEEYFTTKLSLVRQCLKKHLARYCAYTMHNGIQIGLYWVFVRDWLSVFPRDQVHVMLFEEYAQNRTKVVNDIAEFLQIDKLDPPRAARLNAASVVLKGARQQSPPETVVRMLRAFYRSWNRKLAHLLQENRFLWHY